MPVIGIIGGSGLYAVDGLRDAQWRSTDTPWGKPSDALLHGTLGDTRMVFLPRHGRGHVHTPSSVPYRANIVAMKAAGVTHLVSVSATGSFRDEMAPGDFVIVDQFIDRTVGREATFFGPGLVAHVSLAHPTCPDLSAACTKAARDTGTNVHDGGTYLAMEGPQFSTAAESKLYRSWGCDVIGMTNMPEARLAREAELHYASVAMVTDYDSWHPDHGTVQIADILRTLEGNVARAAEMVAALPALLRNGPCAEGCDHALAHAILTAPDARDPAMVERLRTIAGRAL